MSSRIPLFWMGPPRCPIHDVLLDPETACDLCLQDAPDCPDCDGHGEVLHPAYGQHNCPEATALCGRCSGRGRLL